MGFKLGSRAVLAQKQGSPRLCRYIMGKPFARLGRWEELEERRCCILLCKRDRHLAGVQKRGGQRGGGCSSMSSNGMRCGADTMYRCRYVCFVRGGDAVSVGFGGGFDDFVEGRVIAELELYLIRWNIPQVGFCFGKGLSWR